MEKTTKLNKTSHASTLRTTKTRKTTWTPPSLLDAPPAPKGFVHRWIRVENAGLDDKKNLASKLREGWELVKGDEYPDFESPTVENGKHAGVISVGGLLLARMPEELAESRRKYFKSKTEAMDESVDSNMMKDNAHPTMRIQKPERQTRVTFGGPKPDEK